MNFVTSESIVQKRNLIIKALAAQKSIQQQNLQARRQQQNLQARQQQNLRAIQQSVVKEVVEEEVKEEVAVTVEKVAPVQKYIGFTKLQLL
jgi:hypothetical protein